MCIRDRAKTLIELSGSKIESDFGNDEEITINDLREQSDKEKRSKQSKQGKKKIKSK